MSRIRKNLSLGSLRCLKHSGKSLDPFINMKQGRSAPKLRPVCHSKRSSSLVRNNKSLTESIFKDRIKPENKRGPHTAKCKKFSFFKSKLKTQGFFSLRKPPVEKKSLQLISLAPVLQKKLPSTIKPKSIVGRKQIENRVVQRVAKINIKPLARKRKLEMNPNEISFGYHEGASSLLV